MKLWYIRCIFHDQGLEIDGKGKGSNSALVGSAIHHRLTGNYLPMALRESDVTLTSVKAWGELQKKKHCERSRGEP